MATKIEGDALIAFLSKGTRTAKVACVKKSGEPIVAPVWFIVDGKDLIFTTMNTSLKYRVLKREPRVSICVENDTYPFGFATLQGTVDIIEMPTEALLEWTTKIAARYVPSDLTAQFGRRNAAEGGVLVRVSINHSLALEGIAD